jgi:hypothetical protein
MTERGGRTQDRHTAATLPYSSELQLADRPLQHPVFNRRERRRDLLPERFTDGVHRMALEPRAKATAAAARG